MFWFVTFCVGQYVCRILFDVVSSGWIVMRRLCSFQIAVATLRANIKVQDMPGLQVTPLPRRDAVYVNSKALPSSRPHHLHSLR